MSSLNHAELIEVVLPKAHTVLFHRNSEDPLGHHSVGQVRLMRALLDGSRTATALGKLLGLSPSSLTQMTNRMIAAGLVAKESDGHDRRIRKLSLTVDGREMMERRRESRIREAAKVLAEISPEHCARLIELLEEVASVGSMDCAESAP